MLQVIKNAAGTSIKTFHSEATEADNVLWKVCNKSCMNFITVTGVRHALSFSTCRRLNTYRVNLLTKARLICSILQFHSNFYNQIILYSAK